ncbi:MAG TPA: bifunctional 2-polyprenyl-6-hydroxyphenol methylase/3-demethylubiquinol 3-O-methyltransferase UbiG [Chlamydiales bacterium]|nr:bifunctional 2-polyprenyl-6-hydroxyphenol methylase/3-demethylubiquinol 3-O-methyltransferase UbiG [Chlamydiales bacterium]
MERKKDRINNTFYNTLHDRWQTAMDHPVALLRAENAIRNPWIEETIHSHFENKCTILDIGCGAGFLTNPLARKGHAVTGIDLSMSSLETAKQADTTGTVQYLEANAYEIPLPNERFDVVCAMDFLEHVEEPAKVVREAARVLKPNGLFFFYTFNRNFLSWLTVIKGVEWCVRNTPPHMHVYELFIKPSELKKMCVEQNLEILSLSGLRPDFFNKAFWNMLFTRTVPDDFRFTWTRSLTIGYLGLARKELSIP